jgi:hypothetical protein
MEHSNAWRTSRTGAAPEATCSSGTDEFDLARLAGAGLAVQLEMTRSSSPVVLKALVKAALHEEVLERVAMNAHVNEDLVDVLKTRGVGVQVCLAANPATPERVLLELSRGPELVQRLMAERAAGLPESVLEVLVTTPGLGLVGRRVLERLGQRTDLSDALQVRLSSELWAAAALAANPDLRVSAQMPVRFLLRSRDGQDLLTEALSGVDDDVFVLVERFEGSLEELVEVAAEFS